MADDTGLDPPQTEEEDIAATVRVTEQLIEVLMRGSANAEINRIVLRAILRTLGAREASTMAWEVIRLREGVDQLTKITAALNTAVRSLPGFREAKTRGKQLDTLVVGGIFPAAAAAGFTTADARRIAYHYLLQAGKDLDTARKGADRAGAAQKSNRSHKDKKPS